MKAVAGTDDGDAPGDWQGLGDGGGAGDGGGGEGIGARTGEGFVPEVIDNAHIEILGIPFSAQPLRGFIDDFQIFQGVLCEIPGFFWINKSDTITRLNSARLGLVNFYLFLSWFFLLIYEIYFVIFYTMIFYFYFFTLADKFFAMQS